MAALGRLVAELALDSAQFTEGLKRAEKGFADFERSIGKAATGALTSFAGQLLAIETASRVADAAIKSFTETVKGLAALDDAAEKTGATVESLAKLQAQAKISGQAFEGIESALIKLNKGLSGSEDETKGAGKALEFLGIKAKDAQGNLRDSGEITLEVAKKLSEFSDKGPGKAALAMDLFGKSGAQLLPLFKDMASNAQELENVFVGNTEAADQYEKSTARLALQSEQLRRVVVSEILPAINDFLTAILNLKKDGDGLHKTIGDLAADGSLARWARDGTIALGEIIDKTVYGINQFRALGLELGSLAQGAKGVLDSLAAGLASSTGNYAAAAKLFEESDQRFAKAKELSAEATRVAAIQVTTYTNAVSQQAGAFDDARDRALKSATATGELTKKTAEYTTTANGAKDATDKFEKSLADLLEKLESKDSGQDASFYKDTRLLDEALAKGKITLERYFTALDTIFKHSPGYIAETKRLEEATRELAKAAEAEYQSALKNYDVARLTEDVYGDLWESMQKQLEATNQELALTGLTGAAREKKLVDMKLEIALTKELTENERAALIAQAEKLKAAIDNKAAAEDSLKFLEDQARATERTAKTVEDFFVDLFQNGRDAFSNLGNTIKQFFTKLAAQFATKFVLNIVAGGVSGGIGGIASALGFGGGGEGIGGSLGAISLMNGGSSIGTAIGVFDSVLAGTGSVLEGLTAGLSALTGGATAFLGVLGPIGLALGAIYLAWQAFGGDEKGFKFDNSLLTGDDRKEIISSSLGNFDFAGDFENKLIKPFIDSVNKIDDVFAKDLFSAQTLEDVRTQIQNIVNPDWYGGNDEEEIKANIEAASKQFLQARYGVAFDALEAGAGNLVRSFTGTADELIQYIVKLQGAAVAIGKLNKIVPGLNLSLAGFASLSDSAREAVAVLAVSIDAFATDTSKAVEDYIEASTRGVVASYELQAAKLAEMRDGLKDGSVSIEQFAGGIGALATAYAVATAKIAETKMALEEMFSSTQEMFLTDVMSADEKYNYYQKKADEDYQRLLKATDPEEIDRLARRIDNYERMAYGLLDDTARKDKSGEFIAGSKVVEDTVNARLQVASDKLDKQNADLKKVISEALSDFAAKIKATADQEAATADKNAETANTPVKVEVVIKNETSFEVAGGV